MRCKVELRINDKLRNFIFLDDISKGVRYLYEMLKSYNATSLLHKGKWIKVYDLYANKKISKEYRIDFYNVSLRLITKGSKPYDRTLFKQLLKDIDNETL